MNEESGEHPDLAPPQHSSDGRWWWDGRQWRPVQQEEPQRSYPSPPAPGSAQRAGSSDVVPPLTAGTPPAIAVAEGTATTLSSAGWALGLGIAALVVSFLGIATFFLPDNPGAMVATLTFFLLVVLAVLAIVFGIRSQRQIARSHGALSGREMAIAAWICGLCSLAIPGVVVLLGTLMPGS